jgi:hypothetical protein
MTPPGTWIEEDREELICAIVEGMVSRMTLEEMRTIVWDMHYEDIVWQQPSDILMLAEEYAPEMLPDGV